MRIEGVEVLAPEGATHALSFPYSMIEGSDVPAFISDFTAHYDSARGEAEVVGYEIFEGERKVIIWLRETSPILPVVVIAVIIVSAILAGIVVIQVTNTIMASLETHRYELLMDYKNKVLEAREGGLITEETARSLTEEADRSYRESSTGGTDIMSMLTGFLPIILIFMVIGMIPRPRSD